MRRPFNVLGTNISYIYATAKPSYCFENTNILSIHRVDQGIGVIESNYLAPFIYLIEEKDVFTSKKKGSGGTYSYQSHHQQ